MKCAWGCNVNKTLSPNRPYLLRAYYDWLTDNQLTPHLVVDAQVKGTQVPQQYVKDGQIVLNVADGAVIGMDMGNDIVEFNACFGNTPHQVVLPMASIIAIYARENSAGIVFEMEDAYRQLDENDDVDESEDDSNSKKASTKKTSHLKVIK